ncbi:MAG TPA: ATP-binding protein [Kofleriaceae bacterium]|nr:ATP-binding protein [Kofleriaceae bacterium]
MDLAQGSAVSLPARRAARSEPAPARQLRLRLRTKLVVAMAFAALVPVLIVALLATSVILSSLETSLREDADRQLGVAINLILRAVERLGDETIQLAESSDLPATFDDQDALEAWLAREVVHVPAARLQLLDPQGRVVFDRVLGGAEPRFAELGVQPGDPSIANGQDWGRGVSLVALGDRVVVRAVSPIVDRTLALRGVLVLSMPLDGDFADGIKGALSADVLLGGASGQLQTTFRTAVGGRTPPIALGVGDHLVALAGKHVIRNLEVLDRQYKIAATALLDRRSQSVGLVGVAVDRGPLAATKRLAVRSLVAGGLAALAFAFVLALFWSRRLGAPIAELHAGAIAVSRGDLDHRIEIPGGDELTELATAFNQMTSTLQDNQARLAARMREIVALHDAGRAVSSVIDIESVSRKIVDAVARTFDVQLAALWLVDAGDGALRPTAARARRADAASSFATDEALAAAEALRAIAEAVHATRRPVRERRPSLAAAGAPPELPAAVGQADRQDPRTADPSPSVPVIGLPLDRKARIVGVLTVARAVHAREFSEADLNLLTTFADQASAAVENAVLYSEVRAASEQLEKKVQLRTTELTEINHELAKTLGDLRETQAQLVLSERMASLGLLVAGVAHEINSPTAAIRGSIDGLTAALARVSRHGVELIARVAPAQVTRITGAIEALAAALAERPLATGVTARKAAREIAGAIEAMPGPLIAQLPVVALDLADLGATPGEAIRLIDDAGGDRSLAPAVVAALTDHVYLQRTASTVRHAVASIQRIVGALKSYSHLDQQAVRTEADVHEGLETTLALLHHALRDIVIERQFGSLPRIPVFVDELNQVWTNLIQNALQALTQQAATGGNVVIETAVESAWVVVRVIDNGPGVPAAVLPRIFEPFFTTKPKGEGTGLGLGIARQIVHKHGGTMRCESEPGLTMFEVRLPVSAR